MSFVSSFLCVGTLKHVYINLSENKHVFMSSGKLCKKHGCKQQNEGFYRVKVDLVRLKIM